MLLYGLSKELISGPVSFTTYKLLLCTAQFPLPVFDLAKSEMKKTSGRNTAYGGSIQGSKCL